MNRIIFLFFLVLSIFFNRLNATEPATRQSPKTEIVQAEEITSDQKHSEGSSSDQASNPVSNTSKVTESVADDKPRTYEYLSPYHKAMLYDEHKKREFGKTLNALVHKVKFEGDLMSIIGHIRYEAQRMSDAFRFLLSDAERMHTALGYRYSDYMRNTQHRFENHYNELDRQLFKLEQLYRAYKNDKDIRDKAEKIVEDAERNVGLLTFDLDQNIPGMENTTGHCFANTVFRALFASSKFMKRINEISAKEDKLPPFIPKLATMIKNFYADLKKTENTLNDLSRDEKTYHSKIVNSSESIDLLRSRKLLKGTYERYSKMANVIEDILTFQKMVLSKTDSKYPDEIVDRLRGKNKGENSYVFLQDLYRALSIEFDILGLNFREAPLGWFVRTVHYGDIGDEDYECNFNYFTDNRYVDIVGHDITTKTPCDVSAPIVLAIPNDVYNNDSKYHYKELEALGYTEGYPEILKFSINGREFTYKLIAVALHSTGHVSAKFLADNGRWDHANDEFVTIENGGKFKVDPNASILFYEIVDSQE